MTDKLQDDTFGEVVTALIIAAITFPLFFIVVICLDYLTGPVDTTGLGATMRGNPDRYWQVKYHTERGEYEEAARIKRELD